MKYYAIVNDVQLGPLDGPELIRLGLCGSTPVWAEGMPDWVPAAQVPELAALLTGAVQQPAHVPPTPQSAPQPQYAPGSPAAMPPCPPSYLAWAIIVTILCCVPFGIVAIVKSAAVNSAYQNGDYDSALRNSKQAQTWILVSVVTGLVASVLLGVMQFFAGVGLAGL